MLKVVYARYWAAKTAKEQLFKENFACIKFNYKFELFLKKKYRMKDKSERHKITTSNVRK